MATLPCENGAGSINNPNGSPAQTGANNPALKPYVAPELCTGSWQISGLSLDGCASNDQLRQEAYIAESLNISGAPINIFKLLGVHEQGAGSVLTSDSVLLSSQPYPGYPVSGINTGGTWKSLQQGTAVAASAYVGVDFGPKLLANSQQPEYSNSAPKWTEVGSVIITQADHPQEYAKQVSVEIADGRTDVGSVLFTGSGNGLLNSIATGALASQCTVSAVAQNATSFSVSARLSNNAIIDLGTATVGTQFYSTFISFLITAGSTPFTAGDLYTISVSYIWRRVGIFNLIQSPLPQTLNLKAALITKALRVVPTMFTGTGSWAVTALDLHDTVPTVIDGIQDLFFNENRDRDYSLEPILLKAQYSPTDSMSDLSKFGLSILDQYSFNVSFATMVGQLGRPIVVGDIIEVIPELQYDQNLKPIRKFLEVTDAGWASEGFSTSWRPTVYRFSAQQALPSQETRDIFGTLDTQKYLTAESILSDGIGEQLDTTPLTQTEEITKYAANSVPEVGSNDQRPTIVVPPAQALPSISPLGQPTVLQNAGVPGPYVEDGLPPNGEPYGEGFSLPDTSTVIDGAYFRLNYPPDTKIPARLFRYSAVKNRWIYQETDRRGEYSSHRPSVRNIMQSTTKQPLR